MNTPSALRGNLPLLAASAVLITLAYPPFHLFVPSFVCLVPAVLAIERGNADRLPLRSQITSGAWFGALTYGLLLYWMVVALWRYTPLSVLGYLGAVLLLSGYSAALFALSGWIVRAARLSVVLVFPVLWTAQEWTLAHQGPLRFPWLGLGTSLTGYPTMVQLADVVGARGITLLLALANAALALAWTRRRQKRRALVPVVAVAVGIAASAAYGIVRERLLVVRPLGEIALVQPNVSYRDKWDRTLQDSTLGAMLESSAEAHRTANPDLIVWPEAAIPGDLLRRRDWRDRVAAFARGASTPLVVGGLHDVIGPDSARARYNAAFLVDTVGRADRYPVYHKQYLVPVTEQVPFLPRWRLGLRWLGRFTAGDGGAVYDLGIGAFGVLICYESAFEDLSRSYRQEGAEFLVNITNDAWFGRTSTPYQHAAHVVMRAIENRVGIARAANTGISEFVHPLGHEYGRTALETRTQVSGTVWTSDAITVYTRLGDWVGRLAVWLTVALVAYAWWRNRFLI